MRTALTIEPRAGGLRVFIPPIDRLETIFASSPSIEAVAAERQTPVQVEGYPPPIDPRLLVIRVTPDPGVVEVEYPPGGDLARNRRDHARCV